MKSIYEVFALTPLEFGERMLDALNTIQSNNKSKIIDIKYQVTNVKHGVLRSALNNV